MTKVRWGRRQLLWAHKGSLCTGFTLPWLLTSTHPSSTARSPYSNQPHTSHRIWTTQTIRPEKVRKRALTTQEPDILFPEVCICVEGEWGFQFFPIRRESCCGWDYFLNQKKILMRTERSLAMLYFHTTTNKIPNTGRDTTPSHLDILLNARDCCVNLCSFQIVLSHFTVWMNHLFIMLFPGENPKMAHRGL